VAVGRYFAFTASGALVVVDQLWGNQIKQLRIAKESLATILLATKDDLLFAQIHGGGSLPSYLSFEMPDLTKHESSEGEWNQATSSKQGDLAVMTTKSGTLALDTKTGQKLWQGGHWDWKGIHDGWIYFRLQETNGTHVSMNGVEVATGKLRKLYEEILPEDLQMPPEKIEELVRARIEKWRREERERIELQKQRRAEEQEWLEKERQRLGVEPQQE